MVPLSKISGHYWWCLEHTPNECRIACFVYSGKKLVLTDSFSGTLAACQHFLAEHHGSADGVLVADDSTPVRLWSGSDYTLQCGDASSPFLPGIAWADLHVVQGLSTEEPVILCQQTCREALLDLLSSSGFHVSRVVPLALLQTAMLNVNATVPVEAFIRKSTHFRDIWIFHVGEFKGYYRIYGDDRSADAFFQDFLPRRFPGAEAPEIKDTFFEYPGIPSEFASLAFLAHETFNLGIEWAPSLGERNDSIPKMRRKEAYTLRGIAKLSTILSAIAVILLIFMWLIAASYGLYTRSDRAEYMKRLTLDNELQTMSKSLEQQRDAMAELLRHRTRHVSKMAALIENLPPSLWLTRWEIQGNRYTFQGLSEDGEAISKLLANLEKSSHFHQVRLRTTEKTTWKGKSVVRFDMAAEEQE